VTKALLFRKRENKVCGFESIVCRKRRAVCPVVSTVILSIALLLTSCTGPSVYDGPLREKTEVMLSEGREYVVYFEAPTFTMSGGSSSHSARHYPDLERVIAIRDEMGNTIPNTITSGDINAYLWPTSSGISVARFKLQGEDTRGIELNIDMDAYMRFASSYNKRITGASSPTAPRSPNKVVIREAPAVRVTQIIWPAILGLVVVTFVIYYIVRYRKERALKREDSIFWSQVESE